jgi:hypothetical protein
MTRSTLALSLSALLPLAFGCNKGEAAGSGNQDCARYESHLAGLAKEASAVLGQLNGKKLSERDLYALNEIDPSRCKQGKVTQAQQACVLNKKVIGEVAGCFASEKPLEWTSCFKSYSGKCSEDKYRDSGDGVFVASSKRDCESIDGKFAEGPCPAQDAVGACDFGGNTVYYGKGETSFTAATAQKDCVGMGGNFTPKG